ncbi:MAG: SufE family protein [Chitinophagales bacterium]|nr:SufE family protein [Chitinophagales bacterium]
MSINEIQDSIIEDFSMYEDWADKYEFIIELGKELPAMNELYKIEENLIKGCQSRVWLHAHEEEGVLKFQADSDAIITKGIIGLLIKVFSGHTAQEIANTDIYFLKEIGLQEHLSPTRANGLVSMVKQIKNYAIAFNLKS